MIKQISLLAFALGVGLVACSPATPKLIPDPKVRNDKVATDSDNFVFNPKVDIIFVVDNSGSMGVHQSNLSRNINLFVQSFSNSVQIDYNVGVVTSDMKNRNQTGRLQGGVRFVNRSTPNGIAEMARNIMVGTNGDYEEMSFDPVAEALSQPLVGGYNAGFYRQDAHLAVIFITDAEDQSKRYDADSLYQFLVGLKGNRDKVLGYGVIVPSLDRRCDRDETNVTPDMIEDFLGMTINTGKNVFGLCDPNFGQNLANLSQDIARYVGGVIYLTRAPIPETIRVLYGSQTIPSDPKVGWMFDPIRNAVILGQDIVWSTQPAGTKVQVLFDAAQFEEEKQSMKRRQLLVSLAAVFSSALAAALFKWKAWMQSDSTSNSQKNSSSVGSMSQLEKTPIDFQWPVAEPFLFCVHHYDFYPEGNGKYGPQASLLKGREIGMDFTEKDGFRMYHGEEVPGFPVHPHRGFETITIVRKGYVDHADSLGAAGRYGEGDVQWMTAGAGVQHSEMFPMLKTDQPNTLELFQIWLNLPKKSKMVPAHFKMFWSEQIPQIKAPKVHVNLIAGNFQGQQSLQPPPDSWASDANNEVLILLVKLDEGGEITLPKVSEDTNRMLYFFEGSFLEINGAKVVKKTAVKIKDSSEQKIKATAPLSEFLLLQAKKIGEPVVQHGPFVMNTKADIIQTFEDFQKTQFGGWNWERSDMVHGPRIERFAKYPNGKIEKPQS